MHDMPAPAVQYDPAIIQAHAQRLYLTAKTIVATYAILGVLSGASLGYIGAVAAGIKDEAPAVMVAAALMGTIAFMVGRWKSFALRLEAQLALCQLQIETNTRAAATSLSAFMMAPR